MQLLFKEIKKDIDVSELTGLASEIWNSHYPSIIGQKQVDYMIDKMYSVTSLKEQIFRKHNIFIGAYLNQKLAGFISYSNTAERDYFIHKLYVDMKIHSKGIGRALYETAFMDKEVKTIRLTVNRQNIKAVNFYFRLGFIIEKTIDIDIGDGFVMNDFVMLLQK